MNVGLFPCLTKHHAKKAYGGRILNLGSGWKRMIGFTSRPLYPTGPIELEAAWAPDPGLTLQGKENVLPVLRILPDFSVLQAVA